MLRAMTGERIAAPDSFGVSDGTLDAHRPRTACIDHSSARHIVVRSVTFSFTSAAGSTGTTTTSRSP
jgi:hypothetical protein